MSVSLADTTILIVVVLTQWRIVLVSLLLNKSFHYDIRKYLNIHLQVTAYTINMWNIVYSIIL